jgi:hypothetical protein
MLTWGGWGADSTQIEQARASIAAKRRRVGGSEGDGDSDDGDDDQVERQHARGGNTAAASRAAAGGKLGFAALPWELGCAALPLRRRHGSRHRERTRDSFALNITPTALASED